MAIQFDCKNADISAGNQKLLSVELYGVSKEELFDVAREEIGQEEIADMLDEEIIVARCRVLGYDIGEDD